MRHITHFRALSANITEARWHRRERGEFEKAHGSGLDGISIRISRVSQQCASLPASMAIAYSGRLLPWTFIIRNHLLRLDFIHFKTKLLFLSFSSSRHVSKWNHSWILGLTWMSFADRFRRKQKRWVVFHLVAVVDAASIWVTIWFSFGHCWELFFFHWDFSRGLFCRKNVTFDYLRCVGRCFELSFKSFNEF